MSEARDCFRITLVVVLVLTPPLVSSAVVVVVSPRGEVSKTEPSFRLGFVLLESCADGFREPVGPGSDSFCNTHTRKG